MLFLEAQTDTLKNDFTRFFSDVKLGGEDGKKYTLILIFIGQCLVKNGVHLYVLNEKEEKTGLLKTLAV